MIKLKHRISKNKTDDHMRLNQYIAKTGVCSRREADQFIAAGLVSVNDKLITQMGFKVGPNDIVKFNNETIRGERKKYLLLNKPKGFICSDKHTHKNKSVTSLVQDACKEILTPVDNMDRKSIGLLFFTNDYEMIDKIKSKKKNIKNIYHLQLDKKLASDDMKNIIKGININDKFYKIEKISYVKNASKKEIGIEMPSIKKNIIIKLLNHLNYKIIKLDRVYFCGLTKKDLPRGRYRMLKQQEVSMLKMI